LKILVLSFYYKPDLCAGSFRTTALVEALLDYLPEHARIDVITTLPNRYSSFSSEALEVESYPRLSIRRIKLPRHQSGMLDQAKAFITYAREATRLTRNDEYDLVYGTSSRLMTSVLSAYIARKKKAPLYLDIRDIFVDTIGDVLPRKFAMVSKPVFSILEKWAITRANKVNLVSLGFKGYFVTRYPEQNYSYFTNGVDDEFVCAGEKSEPRKRADDVVTVLYAGNMGEGQGLHAIIPQLAKRLEGKVLFRLIGDGGRKKALAAKLKEIACTNVELLPPVKRDLLLKEYQSADVLFLHLNDYPAFEKVLPSKLFEYAAMGKPVWAGLSGYSAKFVNEEIVNAVVFSPCDVGDALESFQRLGLDEVDRAGFIEKYSRGNIMKQMAKDIVSLSCDLKQ